jgi:hypothetical protein
MDDEARVRRAIDAIWNRGELDVANELFTSRYVNHDGLIPDLIHGPDAIKISVAGYRLAFPDLYIAIDTLSSDDDAVVVRWTALSRSPDTRAVGSETQHRLMSGTTRLRLEGGKIAESWTDWNTDRLLN